jgi:ubiquinone/menaquinone biosynthesis C-methylase UbiE
MTTGQSGSHPGTFRVGDIHQQDATRLVEVLDLIAAKPAVQSLKAWALTALAPAPGEAALDVGCGTGEDVLAFAGLVGPTGRAVGVEPSPGLRAEAMKRTADSVELVDGDASALPFAAGTFDVVRCERVLQHIGEPETAVGELVRVLKPGGRIALIDTDWQTAILHPADPDVLERMVANFLSQAANPYSGRRLRGLLAGAGLTIQDETAATWIEPQSGATGEFVAMMASTSAAAGAITQEEADRFFAGVADAAERGAFHLSLTMYAVAAAKAVG